MVDEDIDEDDDFDSESSPSPKRAGKRPAPNEVVELDDD